MGKLRDCMSSLYSNITVDCPKLPSPILIDDIERIIVRCYFQYIDNDVRYWYSIEEFGDEEWAREIRGESR